MHLYILDYQWNKKLSKLSFIASARIFSANKGIFIFSHRLIIACCAKQNVQNVLLIDLLGVMVAAVFVCQPNFGFVCLWFLLYIDQLYTFMLCGA